MLIRPETLELEAASNGARAANTLAGEVITQTFLGPVTRLKVVGAGAEPDRRHVDRAGRDAAGREATSWRTGAGDDARLLSLADEPDIRRRARSGRSVKIAGRRRAPASSRMRAGSFTV